MQWTVIEGKQEVPWWLVAKGLTSSQRAREGSLSLEMRMTNKDRGMHKEGPVLRGRWPVRNKAQRPQAERPRDAGF